MAKLPPACKQLLYLLISKYKWFLNKRLLAGDGSFFYEDKKLAIEMTVDPKTISRHRKRLHKEGLEGNLAVNFRTIPGKHRGVATLYFITPKGDKVSPFPVLQRRTEREADFPIKEDKMSDKGGQNVPPLIENNKESNKENQRPLDFSEHIKGFKGIGWDQQRIKEHLINVQKLTEAQADKEMGKYF